MTQLFLNDTEIDLSSASIQINYSIAKIGDIENRSGARSAQIELPKTAKNRLFFENLDDLASQSVKPYRRIKARLFTDGIDQKILFASLESINDTYNVRVYGENVSFFDLIKAKKLIDLDLKDLDHYRTFNNIKDGRSRTDGYLYPIIDNFADSPNLYMGNVSATAYVQYLYPAMYYEDMLQRICEAEGYTLINNIPNLPLYPTDKLCIPYSSVKFQRNKDMGRYEGLFYSSVLNYSGSTASPDFVKIDSVTNYDYNYFQGVGLGFIDNGVTYGLQFLDGITCDIKMSANITNVSGIDVTGTLKALSLTLDDFNFNISNGATIDVEFNFTKQLGYATNQSALYILSTAIGQNGSNLSPGALEINTITLEITNVVLDTFNEGLEYSTDIQAFTTPSSLLPDWKQSQLFSNYLKMFCGLISVDEYEKTVTLFPFSDIVKNIHNGKDWSDKLDLTKVDEKKFAFDYSQINNLTYKADDTVTKPNGTDGVILIDDENLDGLGDMVKLDFAASEMVTRLNGQTIPQIKMWSGVGGSDEQKDEVEQRVLVVKFVDIPFDYTDGSTPVTVTTDIPLPYFISSETFNLGFENNLLRYYEAFIDVLDRTKILTLDLRLNASDINQLDFSVPVYIQYFGAWFYISQVKAYEPNSYNSTQVELVKLF